jgi:hypothetical protein
MNRPKARTAGRHCFFLCLAILAWALHPVVAQSVGQKQPAIQQVCGRDLELVWGKAIAGKEDKNRVHFRVHPSGKNYWVEVEWLPRQLGSSDEPLYTRNMLIDSNGDKIWERDRGYLDIPYILAGSREVMVGRKLYKYHDRYLTSFGKGLRYHVWLDEEGDILSVHGQRVDDLVWLPGNEPEAGNGVVYNVEPWCSEEGFCAVDRLTVTEKGIDPKGWETMVRWPYPAGSEKGTVYSGLRASSSHLLVYKTEPKAAETEWRLITFSPSGDGRIISETKFLLPADSSSAFIKNKQGGFVFFNFQDGGPYTFMRLDEAGRLIEKKSYRLSETFDTFIQLIRQFKDGWIIEGATRLLRISSDGSPRWLRRLPGDTLDVFVGNGEDTLFFQLGYKLYMCRENKALKK